MDSNTPPRQYNTAQAAKYLQLCKDTVYDIVARRRIKSRRKGPRNGRIYFLKKDLDDYLGL